MSGRGFTIYVKCPMHGWSVYPSGRICPGCELCGEERPDTLWFTAKRHVRTYERERREAAELARPGTSRLLFARAVLSRIMRETPEAGWLAAIAILTRGARRRPWRDRTGRAGTGAD